MDIEFKEGAVCYANKLQHFALADFDTVKKFAHTYDDFQLNTIKQGDCIASSEIDTEQKYNDVVEVFGLFGFKPSAAVLNFNSSKSKSLTCVAGEVWRGFVAELAKRKLTYPQLIAIGELKRLEIEKSAPKIAPDLTPDLVQNPSHYQFFEGVEVIEIIASSMTREQFKGYCLGNRIKYRLRAGNKDKLEQEIAKSDKYVELYDEHKHLCKS